MSEENVAAPGGTSTGQPGGAAPSGGQRGAGAAQPAAPGAPLNRRIDDDDRAAVAFASTWQDDLTNKIGTMQRKASAGRTTRAVIVPAPRRPAEGSTERPERATVVTPFSEFRRLGGDAIGLTAEEQKLTLLDILEADGKAVAGTMLAIKALDDAYGGGGYDVFHDIAFIAGRPDPADLKDLEKGQYPLDDRIAHELGHAEQAKEGIDESNTSKFLMEYDNIIRYENEWQRDVPGRPVRTKYGAPGAVTGRMHQVFRMIASREPGLSTHTRLTFNAMVAYIGLGTTLPGVRSKDPERIAAIVVALGDAALKSTEKAAEIKDNLLREWANHWISQAERSIREPHALGEGATTWNDARADPPGTGGSPGMPKQGSPSTTPRPYVDYVERNADGTPRTTPFVIEDFIDGAFRANMRAALAQEFGSAGPAARDSVLARFEEVGYHLGRPPGKEDAAAAAIGNQVYVPLTRPEYWVYAVTTEPVAAAGAPPTERGAGTKTLNRNKVMATFVHETFHAISWTKGDGPAETLSAEEREHAREDATGFQSLDNGRCGSLMAPADGGFNVSWSLDEAMTDMLAMRAFASVVGQGAVYETNYKIMVNGFPTLWTGQLLDVLVRNDHSLDELKQAYVNQDDARRLAHELQEEKVLLRAVKDEVVAVQSFAVARAVSSPEAAALVLAASPISPDLRRQLHTELTTYACKTDNTPVSIPSAARLEEKATEHRKTVMWSRLPIQSRREMRRRQADAEARERDRLRNTAAPPVGVAAPAVDVTGLEARQLPPMNLIVAGDAAGGGEQGRQS